METNAEFDPTGFIENFISDGVYLRVIHVQQGKTIIGHVHTTNHLSVLLTGTMRISIGDEVKELKAPYIFEALAGSRKVGYAVTDCSVMNILPTDITTVEEIPKFLEEVVDYSASDVSMLPNIISNAKELKCP